MTALCLPIDKLIVPDAVHELLFGDAVKTTSSTNTVVRSA